MDSDRTPRHVAVALVYDAAVRKVLMVSSRAHTGMWILPKGGIEQGESSGQAAVREAYEEAGTSLHLVAPTDEQRLMMLTLEAGAGQKRAAVWHVHVLETSEAEVNAHAKWPESHERIREWVSLKDCLDRIRAWSTDPTTSGDIASQGGVVVEASKAQSKKGKGSKVKKEQKSGAMETALEHFILSRSLESEIE